jgi:hypothetical protein
MMMSVNNSNHKNKNNININNDTEYRWWTEKTALGCQQLLNVDNNPLCHRIITAEEVKQLLLAKCRAMGLSRPPTKLEPVVLLRPVYQNNKYENRGAVLGTKKVHKTKVVMVKVNGKTFDHEVDVKVFDLNI